MYQFLRTLEPNDVEVIASQLYSELLRHGFTAVAEFHYLRNDVDGRPYDDPVEMGRRILMAGQRTGLGLTLLPVLYRASDFGGVPPEHEQRRFVSTVEELVGDVVVLDAMASSGNARVGLGLHSLRAVPPADLAVAVEAVRGIDETAPIHLHIAEQLREVEASVAWSGARPVEWLFDHAPVDERWCLVHATHLDDGETDQLARSGAVVGLCPTTEANLGDGVFPLSRYLEAGGSWAVGTDSHVGRSPVSELRMLEYGQRLSAHARNVAAGAQHRSTGRALLDAAWSGGAQACGRAIGRLEPGYRADIVVLDADHPSLVGRDGDDILDSWIFSEDDTPVRDVFVGGRPVVQCGRHASHSEIGAAYAEVVQRLGVDAPQLTIDFDE
jgi:formimidoylglutamate deiminase